MSEKYYADCTCGRKIQVELYEAGSTKTCPSCQARVSVPDTITLKENSGDRYPHLSYQEKIRVTSSNCEPPFEGSCHCCDSPHADHVIPMKLGIMDERHVKDGVGIKPTITGGVSVTVAASQEEWNIIKFPLYLCDQCLQKYESEQYWSKLMGRAKSVFFVGLLCAFIYFTIFNAEFIAVFGGIIFFLVAVFLAANRGGDKKIDPKISKWVQEVPWLPEVIEAEEEFMLTCDKPILASDYEI